MGGASFVRCFMARFLAALGLCACLVLVAGSAMGDDTPKGKGKAQMKKRPDLTFKKMDTNKDGKVTKEEFQGFMSKFGPQRLRDNADLIDRVFERADSNGDGSLSLDEFKALVERFRERAAKKAPKTDK
jgi:hypothetical protein